MKFNNKSFLKTSLVAIALFGLSNAALAGHHGDDKSKKRHGPPPQAIEACNGLSDGAACKFEGRHGELEGTCMVPHESEDVMACKPKHHKKKG
jgi:hypothetical protein